MFYIPYFPEIGTKNDKNIHHIEIVQTKDVPFPQLSEELSLVRKLSDVTNDSFNTIAGWNYSASPPFIGQYFTTMS